MLLKTCVMLPTCLSFLKTSGYLSGIQHSITKIFLPYRNILLIIWFVLLISGLSMS
jgi:hypothetical protein